MQLTGYGRANKAARIASIEEGYDTVILETYEYESGKYFYTWAFWHIWYPRQNNPEFFGMRDTGFYQNGEWTDELL